MNFKKNPKEFQFGIWFLAIFLLALLLCIYIPRYLIGGTFIVYVRPGKTEEIYSFNVSWASFLQIICLGPIFGIIYFILMKLFLNKVDKNKGRNRQFIFIIEICVLVAICFNCMGHVFHLAFDSVNVLSKSGGVGSGSYNGYNTEEAFLFIWYMDEWLGHSMVHITYFSYLILAVFAEALIDDHEKISLDELFISIICAVGISIVDAWAAIRSESGIILLILHIIFTIIALIVIFIKKINILEHPILLTMILSLIPVVIININYIIIHGIQPYYPFYSSNLS
ncbi:MAG: hypothetical protein ACTSQP_07855 [Promethearchaeota archaeon]